MISIVSWTVEGYWSDVNSFDIPVSCWNWFEPSFVWDCCVVMLWFISWEHRPNCSSISFLVPSRTFSCMDSCLFVDTLAIFGCVLVVVLLLIPSRDCGTPLPFSAAVAENFCRFVNRLVNSLEFSVDMKDNGAVTVSSVVGTDCGALSEVVSRWQSRRTRCTRFKCDNVDESGNRLDKCLIKEAHSFGFCNVTTYASVVDGPDATDENDCFDGWQISINKQSSSFRLILENFRFSRQDEHIS